MADRVFGPHVTGFHFLGLPIGATVEVDRDSTGGAKVPDSLSLVLSSPTGASATIGKVANGATCTVKVSPGIDVTATVNDCRDEPLGAGPQQLFVFKVTLRAQGTAKIGGFIPVPINVQIDAFDVHVPKDDAVHAQIKDAHANA